jgi:opacity protein-like surface antigen
MKNKILTAVACAAMACTASASFAATVQSPNAGNMVHMSQVFTAQQNLQTDVWLGGGAMKNGSCNVDPSSIFKDGTYTFNNSDLFVVGNGTLVRHFGTDINCVNEGYNVGGKDVATISYAVKYNPSTQTYDPTGLVDHVFLDGK